MCGAKRAFCMIAGDRSPGRSATIPPGICSSSQGADGLQHRRKSRVLVRPAWMDSRSARSSKMEMAPVLCDLNTLFINFGRLAELSVVIANLRFDIPTVCNAVFFSLLGFIFRIQIYSQKIQYSSLMIRIRTNHTYMTHHNCNNNHFLCYTYIRDICIHGKISACNSIVHTRNGNRVVGNNMFHICIVHNTMSHDLRRNPPGHQTRHPNSNLSEDRGRSNLPRCYHILDRKVRREHRENIHRRFHRMFARILYHFHRRYDQVFYYDDRLDNLQLVQWRFAFVETHIVMSALWLARKIPDPKYATNDTKTDRLTSLPCLTIVLGFLSHDWKESLFLCNRKLANYLVTHIVKYVNAGHSPYLYSGKNRLDLFALDLPSSFQPLFDIFTRCRRIAVTCYVPLFFSRELSSFSQVRTLSFHYDTRNRQELTLALPNLEHLQVRFLHGLQVRYFSASNCPKLTSCVFKSNDAIENFTVKAEQFSTMLRTLDIRSTRVKIESLPQNLVHFRAAEWSWVCAATSFPETLESLQLGQLLFDTQDVDAFQHGRFQGLAFCGVVKRQLNARSTKSI